MRRRTFLGLLALGCGDAETDMRRSFAPVGRLNRRGIGSAPASASAGPLPLAFWASGGYWDFSSIAGGDNANIASGNAALTSLSNSALLVPSTVVAPQIKINTVGGNNGAQILWNSATGANFQYFTCNALASLFQGSPSGWTVFVHLRTDRAGEMPLWSVLRSDGGSTEQLWGRTVSESMVLRKHTAAGGTVTQTAVRHTDPYSDTLVAWVFNGTNVTIYTRAAGQTNIVVDALGALDTNAFSTGLNRFTFGASVSSVPFEAWDGFLGKCGVSQLAATATQIGQLFDGITAANYVKTQAASGNISTAGASRTLCVQDAISVAGWRDIFSRFCYQNGLSWYTYAQGLAGSPGALPPFRQGNSGNTFTSANSGQASAAIATQAVLDIQNSPGPTRLFVSVLSDEDANLSVLAPQAVTNALAALVSIMNALLVRDSSARIAAFDSPPVQDPTENTLIGTYHTAYFQGGGLYDQFDALYPSNKIFRPSWWTIEGGIWTAADYGADVAHLNHLGCLKGGHVLLNSQDSTGLILGTWLRSHSPSAAKPTTLSGTILSLNNGFSLPHGTPVTLTVDCSRIGFNANIVAGSNAGTAVPSEIYDSFSASGGNSKFVHPQSQFIFTPGAGDVGAMTISVTFTDVDGVTTSTASITGTVS